MVLLEVVSLIVNLKLDLSLEVSSLLQYSSHMVFFNV